MKFLLSWLGDHLEQGAGADTLAERLTAAGLNVETREGHSDDEVWDVDITTNRPDAMNHRGLAREAAAAGCGVLRPVQTVLREGATPAAALANVVVEDVVGCPRYCARVVQGVRIGPSPTWLADRLEACGVRSINNVVDATNFVLLDLGQPLHAFDLDTLADRSIVVRRARSSETMTTLDDVPRSLLADDLVIADSRRAVALAGIMGGAATEISAGTTNVLLESATFDPLMVRRTARRLGLSTEASRRFERGADRMMAGLAVDAAAALVVRVAGGEVAAGVLDSAPEAMAVRRLTMSLSRLETFAGCSIPSDEVLRILAALELSPHLEEGEVVCAVPSHRVDLDLAEDLYEEVLRHFGYDRIPSALPEVAVAPGKRLGSWPVTERGRDALVAAGLAETVTYSFLGPELEEASAASPLGMRGAAVSVVNPLSARLSVLRRSLLGGLAEAAAGNLRRGAERVALGECGRTFFASESGVREEERLAIVLGGVTGSWDAVRPLDFLDLKGVVEGLIEALGGIGLEWRSAAWTVLAEGEGAEIVRDGEVIGIAGRLASSLQDLLELDAPLWVAELDLERSSSRGEPSYQALPRFPAVVADLTVRHRLSLSYAALAEAVRRCGGEWVEEISPVARYRGPGVAADEVKSTLRLVYRHAERSLTQEEVNAAHFGLMESLAEELGVTFT